MCMEISAHGRAEQGESSGKGLHHHQIRLILVMCADHLVLEEIRHRTELKTTSGDKDVQHRIRTTFSREQSAALEQGARP